jgi:hypothetical protein
VPLLRVLVREVRNITQKTERRYGVEDHDEEDASFHGKSQPRRSSTVVVTGGPGTGITNDQWKILHLNLGRFNDSDNDVKAIEAAAASAHSRRASSGRILQTHEVRVQYHPARESSAGIRAGADEKMV